MIAELHELDPLQEALTLTEGQNARKLNPIKKDRTLTGQHARIDGPEGYKH